MSGKRFVGRKKKEFHGETRWAHRLQAGKWGDRKKKGFSLLGSDENGRRTTTRGKRGEKRRRREFSLERCQEKRGAGPREKGKEVGRDLFKRDALEVQRRNWLDRRGGQTGFKRERMEKVLPFAQAERRKFRCKLPLSKRKPCERRKEDA